MTMRPVRCEYQKFVGCPCCSPEWENIDDEYETLGDHNELCEYQDDWDKEHEVTFMGMRDYEI